MDSSILNILPTKIMDASQEARPAQVPVKIQVGFLPLLSKTTKRSVQGFELAPGKQVYPQIKA
ncbi:MAG: TOBE domain-containing protein [Gammaproteobacteria bacterium]|jgi:ABC-type molybdate transport system ATPase subunit